MTLALVLHIDPTVPDFHEYLSVPASDPQSKLARVLRGVSPRLRHHARVPALEVVGFWLWFSTMILAPLILAPQLRITERGLAIRSAGYLWRETLVPTSDVVDLVWEGYTLTLECKTRTITLGVSSSGAFPDYCVRVDRLRAEIRRAQDDTGVHGSRPM